MYESILLTIKKMMDLEDTESFDLDMVVLINAALEDIIDNGAGLYGFSVQSEADTWNDFLLNEENLENAKLYVFAKVKPVLDPTISGTYKDTLLKEADKALWRIKEHRIPAGGY